MAMVVGLGSLRCIKLKLKRVVDSRRRETETETETETEGDSGSRIKTAKPCNSH